MSTEYEVRSTEHEGAPPKPVPRPHADLVAWKKAMDLVVAIYRCTEQLPRREHYGLVTQLERAAVSVPSNIAEGHGRNSERDFLRFLAIAHGSLREIETQIEIAKRLGYIQAETAVRLTVACDDTDRPLRGLMQHLRTRLERQGTKHVGETDSPYDL